VPPPCFSRIFLRCAWSCVAFNCAARCGARVSPFVRDFDVSRILVDSWERRRRRISNRRRNRFHNCAVALWRTGEGDRRYGTKKFRVIWISKFRKVLKYH
jgi:hypothetical protein